QVGGFTGIGTYALATGVTSFTVNSSAPSSAILGEYRVGTGNINNRDVLIDPTSLTGMAAGQVFFFYTSGTELRLDVAPVPEPAMVLGLSAAVLVTLAALRRRRLGLQLSGV